MSSLLSKFVGLLKLKTNDTFKSIAGDDALERVTLDEINEKLRGAKTQRNLLQARVQVMQKALNETKGDIAHYDDLVAFNVNKFKESNEPVYKERGVKAIEAKKELLEKVNESETEINNLVEAVSKIDDMISHLGTIYEKRKTSYKTATTRNEIAKHASAAADLINDLGDFGIDGNGLSDKMKENEELAKIKLDDAIASTSNKKDSFEEDTLSEMKSADSSKAFDELVK